MTPVRPFARFRAAVAVLGVALLTLSAAGAIVLVTAQPAHAVAVVITSPTATAGITQNPTPFTGTGTPGDTVTLTGTLLTSSPCASGVTVDTGGNWSCDADFSAPGGSHNRRRDPDRRRIDRQRSVRRRLSADRATDLDIAGALRDQQQQSRHPRHGCHHLGTVHGTLTNGTNTYDCFYNVVSGPSFSCVGFSAVPDGDYTLQLTQRSAPPPPCRPRRSRSGSIRPARTPPRGFSRRTTARARNHAANVHTTDPSCRCRAHTSPLVFPRQFATVHVVADVEPGPISTISSATPIYCDAITDAAGNWACTPSTPMTFGDFYGFTVYGVDEAGNTGISPDPEFGVYVDVPAPAPDSQVVVVNQPIVELTGTGVARRQHPRELQQRAELRRGRELGLLRVRRHARTGDRRHVFRGPHPDRRHQQLADHRSHGDPRPDPADRPPHLLRPRGRPARVLRVRCRPPSRRSRAAPTRTPR